MNRHNVKKLISALNRTADVVLLNILWIVTSIPIITIGLASSSAFHTYQITIVQGKGHVIQTYFQSFQQNWKQAFPIGILLVAAQICSLVLLRNTINGDGQEITILTAISFYFLIVLNYQLYVYPLIGHYNLNTLQIFYIASRLILFHPLCSFTLAIISGVLIICIVYYPPMILLAPGGYFFLTSKIYNYLFSKYIKTADNLHQKLTDNE